MIRQVVAVAALLYFISAAPINSIDDIPPEYKELLPEQAKEFLTTLTEDEKDVIRAMVADYDKFKDEHEVMAELKKKSQKLGEKLEQLHAMLTAKIDALGDEAKAFIKEVIGDARKLHASAVAGNTVNMNDVKERARQAMMKYKFLSYAAKQDLQEQFPILTSVFKNEKFQKTVEALLAVN